MKKKLKLVLLSLTITLLGGFAGVTADAHPATGIVVDRTGVIYFSDLETIWKIGIDGKLSVFRPGERGRHVHELSIDQEGNIFGADVSYNPATKGWITDVWKMNPKGELTYLLEPTEKAPRGLSIWRDRAGNNYFIDQNNHTKSQTLLLRRTPDDIVDVLAGSAYGHADGKGSAARFSSVGGMFLDDAGNVYLSDGTSVRKVSNDGTVTTLARNLDFKTSEDDPRLFAAYGSLAGLTADQNSNVYVADAGKRRLLKIDRDGRVSVALRSEPPFFPNGVASAGGNIYVLEVGLTVPNMWSGPRIRRIDPAGRITTLGIVGGEPNRSVGSTISTNAGVTVERAMVAATADGRTKYSVTALVTAVAFVITTIFLRRRRKRART